MNAVLPSRLKPMFEPPWSNPAVKMPMTIAEFGARSRGHLRRAPDARLRRAAAEVMRENRRGREPRVSGDAVARTPWLRSAVSRLEQSVPRPSRLIVSPVHACLAGASPVPRRCNAVQGATASLAFTATAAMGILQLTESKGARGVRIGIATCPEHALAEPRGRLCSDAPWHIPPQHATMRAPRPPRHAEGAKRTWTGKPFSVIRYSLSIADTGCAV